MLTPHDDRLGHQVPTTFDHAGTSDPDWMERYWYGGNNVPAGDLVFDIGFGLNINKNVMDGYATFSKGGRQFNARFSRRARPDPLTPTIGPFRIEVLEGMRSHRVALDPGEAALSLDIVFTATMMPHEEATHFRRRNGRVTEDLLRYAQVGRCSGWIQAGDERVELTETEWWCQRDHSWGVRAEFRTDETTPPVTRFPPFFFHWTPIQFEDRALHLFLNERAPGDVIYFSGEEVFPLGSGRKGRRLTGMSHDIRWADDPLGQSWESGSFQLRFEDGDEQTLTFRTTPGRAFLKGGLYGGLNGWFHGDDKGKFYAEHEVWDLEDPATRRLARTISTHPLVVQYAGLTGYGISQYGVTRGYPGYEAAQAFPAP